MTDRTRPRALDLDSFYHFVDREFRSLVRIFETSPNVESIDVCLTKLDNLQTQLARIQDDGRRTQIQIDAHISLVNQLEVSTI